jgi:acetyl esterase
MPLDPQIRTILDDVAARGGPKLWDLPIGEARRLTADAMLLLRSFGVEDVVAVTDRTIPGPAGPIPVRTYVPHGYEPFGVLVYLHGSGFVMCDLDTHDQLCRILTNRGRCVVVSVDYRLAPEHPFPAAVDDAWAATRWVQDNAAELGGDRERVAVGGDSAGANLAAVVALHNREDRRVRLKQQLLIYPSTDRRGGYASLHDNGEGYLLTGEMREWFRRCYLPPDVDLADWRVSPLCAPSHADVAPAVVVTAEFDPLRDEGDAYADALRAAGVPVEHIRAAGMIHGFVQYAPFHEGARAVVDQVGGLLRRALA